MKTFRGNIRMGAFLNVEPNFYSNYILLSSRENQTYIKANSFMKQGKNNYINNSTNKNFGGQKIKCYRMSRSNKNINTNVK